MEFQLGTFFSSVGLRMECLCGNTTVEFIAYVRHK